MINANKIAASIGNKTQHEISCNQKSNSID